MGFGVVVILGMDHRYAYKGSPSESRQLEGDDPNHFDPGYFSGHTWGNPDLANSVRYYAMARVPLRQMVAELLTAQWEEPAHCLRRVALRRCLHDISADHRRCWLH